MYAYIKHHVVNYSVYNFYLSILKSSWALVAHACNPSYFGGRDQEDHY
jgi:hypothetical protein